jgi:hypothetical protein
MDYSQLKPLHEDEVVPVIKRAMCFGGRLQQMGLEIGATAPIKFIEADPNGGIRLELAEEVELELDRPIWISLAYRQLTFRLEPGQFSTQGNAIHASYPKSAKALDNRITDRYVLPQTYHVKCQLRRTEKRSSDSDLLVKIVDLSLSGLGISLSGISAEEEVLVKNDHVWIQTINQHVLENPIFGRVVYVSERKYKDGSLELRVGIALNAGLPKGIFDELSDLCLLVLTA